MPEHTLKADILICAEALVNDQPLPWPEGLRIMGEIGLHPAQRAALGIAYFASDGESEEGDAALDALSEEIRAGWEAAGV
jgi:hypothetical protein